MTYEIIPGTGGRKFRHKAPVAHPMTPCPLTSREGPYLLTCRLEAGHEGCCWCEDIAVAGEED